MSSQLISVVSPRLSLSSPPTAGEGPPAINKQTLAGVFGALLDRARMAVGEGAEPAGSATVQQALGTFVPIAIDTEVTAAPGKALAEAALDEAGVPTAPTDETPIAVSMEEPPPADLGTALGELAELLGALETALDAGDTPDPTLLERLGKALEAVASLLQVPVDPTQPAMAPLPDGDLAVTLAEEPDTGGRATPRGTSERPDNAAVVPLPKALGRMLDTLAERLGTADATLTEKLTALADKLGTIKHALADVLAAQPELKAALEQLVAPRFQVKAETATPPFTSAQLRLPETASLTAKEQAASTPAQSAAAGTESPGAPDVEAANVRTAPVTASDDKPVAVTIAVAEKREGTTANVPVSAPAPATAAADAQAGLPASGQVAAPALDGGTTRVVHAAYSAPSPINLPHMALEIARQVQQGVSKFQIRLDPPELGRVDVKLDMDASGNVNAKLIVERAETLDLLQRDQRALERALAQAGLDASKTNLEFSLKQNPFAQQDGKGQQAAGSPFADPRGLVAAEAEPVPATTVYRGTAPPGGVNIFV